MSSIKVRNQVHKCISRNTNPSISSFCAYCGKFMSQTKNSTMYYRSEKYNVVDPYRLDGNTILSEMTKKQNNNRLYNPQAQFIKYRSELLGFVKYIQGRLEYSERTYYLGLNILDNLLSQYSVEKNQLKVVCFMALHMAAKMEENGEKVPELTIIAKLFEGRYDVQDLKNWEVALSKSVGHNFNIRTPYTFVEYFLSRGVVNQEDVNKRDEKLAEEEVNKFESVVMNLLQISSSNYDFYKFNPITVAAAILACSRKVSGYQTCWSRDLEQLTTMKLRDIEACAKLLYKLHRNANDSSMEIEETKSVDNKSQTSLKTNSAEENNGSNARMAVEPSVCKPGRVTSEFMVIDTDEDEPVKNKTTYRSQRVA